MKRVLLAVALAGCGSAEPAPSYPPSLFARVPPPTSHGVDRVILVTVDGTRPQEVFDGVDPVLAARDGLPREAAVDARRLLPNLYARLVDRGVALRVDASGPSYVSLPGYREILSGRPDPRCTSNDCPPLDAPTLLDELRGDDPVVIASWEVMEHAISVEPRALTSSTGRHGGHGRDRLRVTAAAARVLDRADGPWPGHADYRRDRDTADLALAYLAARRPRFLVVGLGDTDEHAHRDDYRGYLDALRAADDFVARLFVLLDSFGDGARTVVLVTADHGRARNFRDHGADPESRATWLLAAGGPIAPRGLVETTPRHRLADLAPTVRALVDLPPDRSPGAGSPIAELLPLPASPAPHVPNGHGADGVIPPLHGAEDARNRPRMRSAVARCSGLRSGRSL